MGTYSISGSISSQWQQFQQEFKQLGSDLSSGNISAAQSDFATLERDATNQFLCVGSAKQ